MREKVPGYRNLCPIAEPFPAAYRIRQRDEVVTAEEGRWFECFPPLVFDVDLPDGVTHRVRVGRGEAGETGIWACPNGHHVCAVVFGRLVVIDVREPSLVVDGDAEQLEVQAVYEVEHHGLLIFGSRRSALALGADGVRWRWWPESTTELRVTEVSGDTVRGWREVSSQWVEEFVLDTASGRVCDSS